VIIAPDAAASPNGGRKGALWGGEIELPQAPASERNQHSAGAHRSLLQRSRSSTLPWASVQNVPWRRLLLVFVRYASQLEYGGSSASTGSLAKRGHEHCRACIDARDTGEWFGANPYAPRVALVVAL
jgi:hypothetical protein